MHQPSHVFSRYLALAAILFTSGVACRPSSSGETSGGGASGSGAGGSNSSGTNSSGGSGGDSTSDKGGNGGSSSQAGSPGGSSSGGSSSGGSSSPGGSPGGSSSPGGSISGGGASSGGSGGSGSTSVTPGSCTAGPEKDPMMPGYPDDKTWQDKAATAVQGMSIADKATEMRGTDPGASAANRNWTDIFRQPDNKNGIAGFTYRDGPRGVNLDAPIQATGVAHAKSTVFPVPMARGAAWDVDLEYRIGLAIGDEMVAAKQTVMLGPTINLLRHPLWGRAQETYGEDPFQLGRFGTAHVAGVQQYVIACPKHFLGNNIENKRASKNAQMDDQTLHEIYGRHFEMTIQDGGAACIMSAYNLVNGKNCTQNGAVLNDLLRKDFGFKGFVLTDWWAMPGGSSGSPNASYATESIKAGNDIELPWNWHYSNIESSIGSGLSQSDIDTSVKRILAQKYRFNADKAGGSLKSTSSSVSGGSVSSGDHEKIALEAAQKSMVLLKNDKSTLPIPSSVKKIAVLGLTISYYQETTDSKGINNKADDVNGGTVDFARGIRVGDVGSSRVNFDKSRSKSPFDGIKDAAGSATVVAGDKVDDTNKDADYFVVVAGLTPFDEGEEYNNSGDRTDLKLDAKDNGRSNAGKQEALIKAAVATTKPVVVILEGGSVIDISAWENSVSAIVMAWYPGMLGGTAMGELLFGKKNFSGKLPISWPKTLSDLPAFDPGATTPMDYYVGYRYYDKENKEPRFPFGYGLSYTKYEYSNLSLPCADATSSAVVKVSVDVSNKGSVDGDEVVLLFASYPDTKARRPAKELKGFARVSVPAGGKKTVTIPLRVSDLKYWNSSDKKWVVETGAVKVQVGPSSADLPLSGTFNVK